MADIAVKMLPSAAQAKGGRNGIARVVEAYAKYLPNYGVRLVAPEADTYDLIATHAGAGGAGADVAHCHGLYWTADYQAARWEYKTNRVVIDSVRHARMVTVPSDWVAQSFRRDMHLSPVVVPHGIDWADWQTPVESAGYVLWNKNRRGDVCDPTAVGELARRFGALRFITTFAPDDRPGNMSVTGALPFHQMKRLVTKAGVYLATTKETFGIGILEAMASGVPVLAFDQGGAREMVRHGVNGYMATAGDYEDLAAGLQYCLDNRDALGANARQLARFWTWERAVEKVAEAYRSVLHPLLPTAAIIIPCYNYADKVGMAVESALAQTYGQLTDVVVVDDGSNDAGAVEAAVKPYMERDSRVRLVRQDNLGVAHARNRGIRETQAKYICCLDADDRVLPEFLSTLVPALEDDRSLGVAYSGLLVVTPSGKVRRGDWPGPCDFEAQMRGHNQVPTCCLFRREAWVRAGGYRQRYAPTGCGAEDAEFWLRLGAAGWGIRQVTREPMFVYRMGGLTTGNRGYKEVDWLYWHPWTRDSVHPFASIAKPAYEAHPVRQYDDPIISVVIPVGPSHRGAVLNALDSLEAQTFRQWEAIVVDDSGAGGIDMTPTPFARYIRTAGKEGAGYARNRGAEMARAPFLLFLDADDWLMPEALEGMLRGYSAGKPAIIYSDSIGLMILSNEAVKEFEERDELVSYDQRTGLATIINRAANYIPDTAKAQPFTPKPYFWCYVSSLLPRTWHYEAGGFNEDLPAWEDWVYWINLARLGKPFRAVREPLLVYRFYSGTRREAGRAIKKELMGAIRALYLDEKGQTSG